MKSLPGKKGPVYHWMKSGVSGFQVCIELDCTGTRYSVVPVGCCSSELKVCAHLDLSPLDFRQCRTNISFWNYDYFYTSFSLNIFFVSVLSCDFSFAQPVLGHSVVFSDSGGFLHLFLIEVCIVAYLLNVFLVFFNVGCLLLYTFIAQTGACFFLEVCIDIFRRDGCKETQSYNTGLCFWYKL